jgi:hypothetical protein
MSILRNSVRERYTVVSANITADPNLSMKARGLLITLLSLPDCWDFSEAGLCKILAKDGLTSIKSGLKELELAGYLKRQQTRDTKGRINGVEWTICEAPKTQLPTSEKPMSENPTSVNQQQYNTNISNTKELNTKQSNNAFNNAYHFRDRCDSNTPLFDEVFPFYSNLYESKTGKPHAHIKQEQRERIETVFADICNREQFGAEGIMAIAEDFFESVPNTDYNINHFATEGMLYTHYQRIK